MQGANYTTTQLHTGRIKKDKKEVIGKYSYDLAEKESSKELLFNEWLNSRGLMFRFTRSALELKVLDEQEYIKSDVAFSCFIRTALWVEKLLFHNNNSRSNNLIPFRNSHHT